MSSPREIAVLYLHQIIEQKILPSEELSGEALPFIKMLTLTALRNNVSLQKIISRFLAKPIKTKQTVLSSILLCGTTELFFMDSPSYAVLNSYVELAKKLCGKSSSGFINAILHKLLANKEQLLKNYHNEFFPDSFYKILKSDYSSAEIAKIAASSTQEPLLNLSVKNNPELWAQKLGGKVIFQNLIALSPKGSISTLKGYEQGQWWVQDVSAALAAMQFDDLTGKRVLDLCAAPGGKTAQLLNAGAKVTSLDCDNKRLDILKQNMDRLHLTPQEIICADALEYLQNYSGKPFDAVLLDAPCSATGIFRRHPETLYLKNRQDISNQAKLQKQILQYIPRVLNTGGEFVYCTCSIAKDEGEQQILSFVDSFPQFKIHQATQVPDKQMLSKEGFIRTLPHHLPQTNGCDAFFIAKMIKES